MTGRTDEKSAENRPVRQKLGKAIFPYAGKVNQKVSLG